MKGVMRFGKKGKISPRYVVLYKMLKRISKVAYELELPAKISSSASTLPHLTLVEVRG